MTEMAVFFSTRMIQFKMKGIMYYGYLTLDKLEQNYFVFGMFNSKITV